VSAAKSPSYAGKIVPTRANLGGKFWQIILLPPLTNDLNVWYTIGAS